MSTDTAGNPLQAREPDRRCFLKFDKLIVDDSAYIYNELEGRVEKLPNKVGELWNKWCWVCAGSSVQLYHGPDWQL